MGGAPPSPSPLPILTSHKAGVARRAGDADQLTAEKEATFRRDCRRGHAPPRRRGSAATGVSSATATRSCRRREEVEQLAQDSYQLGQTGIAALLQALQASRDVAPARAGCWLAIRDRARRPRARHWSATSMTRHAAVADRSSCWDGDLVALAGCGHEAAEEVESETAVSGQDGRRPRSAAFAASVHATGIVTRARAPSSSSLHQKRRGLRRSRRPPASRCAAAMCSSGSRFHHPSRSFNDRRPRSSGRGAAVENAPRLRRARETSSIVASPRAGTSKTAIRAMADAEAALTQAQASLVGAQSRRRPLDRARDLRRVRHQAHHNPGDLVEATSADPVLRIIDPRRLEVVAAVPFADASRITVGARCPYRRRIEPVRRRSR